MSRDTRLFRDHLTRWFLMVVACVAIPVLAVELRRPWDRLHRIVETSNAVLATTVVDLTPADLEAMNRVALQGVEGEPQEDERAAAAGLWFLVESLPVPSQEEMDRILEENGAEPGLSRDQVEAARIRWEQVLAAEPDPAATRQAFQKTRQELQGARQALARVGLDVDDVYLTLDTGLAADGFFKDNLALVVGALDWWDDCVYPGQAINVTEMDGLFWRAAYLPALGGAPDTFGSNPIHDPILPRFETDEWGTWFSIWYALEAVPGQYNTVTLDIDASAVRRLMATIALILLASATLTGLVVVVVSRYLASWVSRPVAELLAGARAVARMDYGHVVPAVGEGEFISLIDTFNEMVTHLKERVNLLQALEKVLSPELAAAAAHNGLMLGGDVAHVTVLFTDFAGFSSLTRNMKAPDVVEALNAYFVELVPIIRAHGGFADKYIGDAILAIFGAPVRFEDHALRAVRCAVEMQRRMRQINERRRAAGKVVFEMRIGLNTGEVVVGAIGCNEKLEYTSIGESTNLANRMESICPIGQVMVADGCYKLVRGQTLEGVTVATPELLAVKGYPEPVTAWPFLVDDQVVAKNPQAPTPAEFYVYSRRPSDPAAPGSTPHVPT